MTFPGLRHYQVSLIKKIKLAIDNGYRSILAVSPTGSGKTVIFGSIAANAAMHGKKILTLSHRQEIFRQIVRAYSAFGISSGQILAGRPMTKNPVQVAMVQTVVNRLQDIDRPDIIIIDEGHHAVASSWLKILSTFPDALKLFFTATPQRLDGRGLGDVCSSMVLGETVLQLVRDGWLSMPMVKQPGPEFISEFHVRRGDYDKEEQTKFYTKRKIIGDVIEHHRANLHRQPTISFVASLAHGAIMEEMYRDAGIKAKLIQGGQKYMRERERACLELADGSLEILISCDVISEGFDVPVVAGCHMLRKTASLALNDQQIGRALRPIYADGYCLDTVPGRLAAIKAGPKPYAIILDFAGNSLEHPHILQERDWQLNSQKRSRKKQKPNITHCPKCGGVWPGKPRVCPDPKCRYDFVTASTQRRQEVVQQVKGKLVDAIPELSVEDLDRLSAVFAIGDSKEKQKIMMREAWKAVATDSREKLKTLARLAGYRDGWTEWAWNYVNNKRQG